MRTGFGRIKGVFAVLGVVSIVIFYAIITGWNPLPGWANWLENASFTQLSTPATLWTARVGNQPSSATVLPTGIVVATGGSVEVHNPVTGALAWHQDDIWAGVAGNTKTVVIVGRPIKTGFDVYDTVSGAWLWGSNEKAGVWAYQDKILILTCPRNCTLTAVTVDNKTLWSTPIVGDGSKLMGFDRALAALSDVASDYAAAADAQPVAAPPLIGLPMAGKVHVIDTANGKPLQVFSTSDKTQVVVAGNVVVASTASARGDQCYYTAEGMDPKTGAQLWQKTGLDLRTSTPLGCEVAKNPVGNGDRLVATDTSGRDVVFDVADQKILVQGAAGERVVAMDDQIALVRSANGLTIRAVSLSTGHLMWQASLAKVATVGVAAGYVVVVDPTQMGTITLYAEPNGAMISTVKSDATVLGFGPTSVVINVGRTIGTLPVT